MVYSARAKYLASLCGLVSSSYYYNPLGLNII